MSENNNEVLLQVDNLVKQFPIKRGLLIQKQIGAGKPVLLEFQSPF